MAPELLTLESVVLGLYLAFALLTSFQLKNDVAAFVPRNKFAQKFAMGVLLICWITFSYLLGIDQTMLALEISLGIILSTVHPALATGFFLIILFLRPWEIATVGANLFSVLPRSFGVLALMSAISYLVRARTTQLRLGPAVYLMCGFAFWTFLSTFKSYDPPTAQGNYIDAFFKSVVLFILISQAIRDYLGYRILKASLIFAALGISLVSIYRTVNTDDLTRLGSFGLLADPNDISAVMVMIVPLAFYVLVRRDPSIFLRFICVGTLISAAILFYYAKSRGAVLSLLITIAGMALLRVKNKRTAVIGSLVALSLFLPIAQSFKRSEADLSESSESRVIYWQTAFNMAIHHPVFGVGFGGYPENFERYAPRVIETGYRTAHSSWFLCLAETGFLGLILFASLYGWAIRTSWRLREYFPEVFFSTLGYGVAMSFLSHTYLIYFYVLLGIVFVVSRLPKIEPLTNETVGG
jgi:O-antigen ligase